MTHKTLIWIAAAGLATSLAACQPSEKAATDAPAKPADGKPAADGKAAPAGKTAAKGPASAPAKPADGKTAANKGPASAPAKPADAKPAGKTPPAATGDMPLGKNDPSFLAGIEGKEGGKLMTTIETSMGSFTCELYEKKAPNAVMNFVGLARGLKSFKDPTGKITKRAFYEGIQFHRVIPKFMIQVGDPTATGSYNPGYGFANEIAPDLKHTSGGLLSMANTGRPNSNGSQFFITEVATPHLDGRHPIFGKCNEVDLVKEIARSPTGPGNKPLKPITIKKVTFKRQ